ncbi:phosphate ABC transporter permease subunit PstC [Pseudonocardia acidicola]|nr:phosphate ABC transporter permease subunit PstC [Pseudonocardia acidicola]
MEEFETAVADVTSRHSRGENPGTRPAASSAGSVAPTAGPPGELSRRRPRRGDTGFRLLATGAGVLLLGIMAAIAVFLLLEAIPAISADRSNFLTTLGWSPDDSPSSFGIAALAFGSVLSSLLALLIGVPVAVGVALVTSHYAPRWLGGPLGYVIDLLAAVPSVIFGLWGLIYLVPAMIPLAQFLNRYLGFIPLFASDGTFGKSVLVASVVLAVMILPIVAAVSREVFGQTPRDHIEAAYAIGATKWEMVRTAILPYGRSGMVSATVLGFGRAIGETIAVALVLSANYQISFRILEPGGNTIAANIANTYGEAGATGRGALIASGLILFAITLIVNFAARAIVKRGVAR